MTRSTSARSGSTRCAGRSPGSDRGVRPLAGVALAALYARERTGRGQRVEVDPLGSLLAGLVNQASAYVNAGVVPGRMGNRHPSIAPYETLRCADRPIAVAVGNDGQFARLCGVLGLVVLAAHPRFASNAARVAHRSVLVSALESALAARPAADRVDALAMKARA